MKTMKPKMPKLPRLSGVPGQMSNVGENHFPRSVSSATTHTLPAPKGPASMSFDNQITTPSVAIKPVKVPKIATVGTVQGVPSIGLKPGKGI
jgi:hypothetical protein